MKKIYFWRGLLAALCLLMLDLFPVLSLAANYQIGVYYYPGWSPYVKGAHEPDPWAAIKPYAEREPALGWYHDGKVATLEQQLHWMHQYGIDFVVYDWYWENAKPAAESSVRAYLQAPARKDVNYALLWANHNNEPRTLAEWDALVDYWLSHHLKNREYLKIDGKPVIFVFSGDMLFKQAKSIGLNVSQMLSRARDRARASGLSDVYLVLCVPATDYWVQNFAIKSGFDAISGYNYHFGISGNASLRSPDSRNYAELDAGYRKQWNWILANSKLPYFPPMTTGWDRRPWGGSQIADHDNSVSTPATFHAHISAAKAMMDRFPAKTRQIGLICCWNEYGEGSYVEPTKNYGTQYLEQVQSVFGGGARRVSSGTPAVRAESAK